MAKPAATKALIHYKKSFDKIKKSSWRIEPAASNTQGTCATTKAHHLQ